MGDTQNETTQQPNEMHQKSKLFVELIILSRMEEGEVNKHRNPQGGRKPDDHRRSGDRPHNRGHRGGGGFRGGRGRHDRGGGRDRGRSGHPSKRSRRDGNDDNEEEEEDNANDSKKDEQEDLNEDELLGEEEEGESGDEMAISTQFFSEAILGVSEYANKDGFGITQGKLKVLPDDFFVNEIGDDGKVVELTEPLERVSPTATSSSSTAAAGETTPATAASNDTAVDSNLDATLLAFKQDLATKQVELTVRDEQAIKELIATKPQHGKTFSAAMEAKITDKSVRGFVHQSIRKHLSPFVTSTTLDDQRISLQRASQDQLRKDMRRSRAGTDLAKQKPHIELVLRKRNVDTNHCISEMAKLCRAPRKNFGIAGTKDKRAITTQKISIRFGSVADLKLKCSGIVTCGQKEDQTFQIGNIVETDEVRFLGALKGNRFAIAVRNLERRGDKNNDVNLDSWTKIGFVNYFGSQRFGTAEIGTHQVGVALINRDYQAAIDLILRPRKGEDDRLREIREMYQRTKDARKLLETLPRRCTAERAVANGLSQGQDPLKCLLMIPRNTLTMYLHAVQSLVWNQAASLRVKHYGSERPIKGDLVKTKDGKVVRVVTEEDAKTFTIHDVVLGLPGANTEYPGTDMVNAGTFETLLKEMGVTNGLDQLSLQTPKDLALTGSYRPLLARPDQVKYRLARYDTDSQIFFASDGQFPESEQFRTGSKEALLLSFQLPSGTYATMAIRELIRPASSS